MAEDKRKDFRVHGDWRWYFELLSDDGKRSNVFMALWQYSDTGKTPKFKSVEETMAFMCMKQDIDGDKRKEER